MKKIEAEIIALNYIIGWASLNIDVREDYYDDIPHHHLPDGFTNENRDGDYGNHLPSEKEMSLISKAFEKFTLQLILKKQKLEETLNKEKSSKKP